MTIPPALERTMAKWERHGIDPRRLDRFEVK